MFKIKHHIDPILLSLGRLCYLGSMILRYSQMTGSMFTLETNISDIQHRVDLTGCMGHFHDQCRHPGSLT